MKGFGIIDIVMLSFTFIFLIIMLANVVGPAISQYYPTISQDFPTTGELVKFVPLAFILAFIGYIFVRASGGIGMRGE